MKHFLLFITALFFSITNITAQTILQVKPKVGSKFILSTKITNDMELSFGGETKKAFTKTKYFYHASVKNINDKNEIEFEFVIDSLLLLIKEDEKQQFINSNKPETYKDDEKLSSIGDQINKPYIVKVAANGKLIKDEDADLPQIIDYCFIQFAEKAVNLNEVWKSKEVNKSNGFEMETTTESKIISVENNTAVVESSAYNKMMGKDPVVTKMNCDINTGMVSSYTSKMEMNMMGTMKIEVIHDCKLQ